MYREKIIFIVPEASPYLAIHTSIQISRVHCYHPAHHLSLTTSFFLWKQKNLFENPSLLIFFFGKKLWISSSCWVMTRWHTWSKRWKLKIISFFFSAKIVYFDHPWALWFIQFCSPTWVSINRMCAKFPHISFHCEWRGIDWILFLGRKIARTVIEKIFTHGQIHNVVALKRDR